MSHARRKRRLVPGGSIKKCVPQLVLGLGAQFPASRQGDESIYQVGEEGAIAGEGDRGWHSRFGHDVAASTNEEKGIWPE